MSNTNEDYITIALAAEMFNITKKTIYRYFNRGLLPSIKVNSVIHVKIADVKTCIDQSKAKSSNLTKTPAGNVKMEKLYFDLLQRHEAALIQLGRFQKNETLLLEYQKDLEKKDAELEMHKKNVDSVSNWIMEIDEENKEYKKTICDNRKLIEGMSVKYQMLERKLHQDRIAKNKELENKDKLIAQLHDKIDRMRQSTEEFKNKNKSFFKRIFRKKNR